MEANPARKATLDHVRRIGLNPPGGVLSRHHKLQPAAHRIGLVYPLPNYMMWRGNFNWYIYNKNQCSMWGEGETKKKYHQYFSHAKCPTDYGRAGREFELIKIARGKALKKPLPQVQYVKKDSKPTWHFKSWHNELGSYGIWRREVQYPEHVPEHLNAKRPLATLAPTTKYRHLQLAYMEKIVITVCPLLFGYGMTIQKEVLDFFRHALSARTPFPQEKVFLLYAMDFITPKIEVTWTDGSVYRVPVFEGSKYMDFMQLIMEQSWLVGDRLDAANVQLPPLAFDDFKWKEVIEIKKLKSELAAAAAQEEPKK